LWFAYEKSEVDQYGKKQRRFDVGMMVGITDTHTGVVGPPETENRTALETRFVFSGVGCLKAVLWVGVVEQSLSFQRERGYETAQLSLLECKVEQPKMDVLTEWSEADVY
jgi:hypothetical protein